MTYFFAGFSAWLVQYLVYLKELPIWAINLIVSTLTATMTEVVSNTATANILLPILKEMSLTLCYNPVYMGETETLGTFELDNTETVTLLNLLNVSTWVHPTLTCAVMGQPRSSRCKSFQSKAARCPEFDPDQPGAKAS